MLNVYVSSQTSVGESSTGFNIPEFLSLLAAHRTSIAIYKISHPMFLGLSPDASKYFLLLQALVLPL